MRPLSQGAARIADARIDRGTHVDGRPRRGSTAAGTASLIGAIIAGGASSRFGGEPKGLAVVGGRRIIDRVADALSSVASETGELLVVSNAPDAAEWLPGARVATDVREERGSLVGLHAALVHARDTVLVVAWDMPFVTRELVSLIAQRATRSEYAAVPLGATGPEPFCAAYTPACLPFVTAALDARDFRLSALLARLPNVAYVSARELSAAGDPARLFFNVNSAADLDTANRMAAGG